MLVVAVLNLPPVRMLHLVRASYTEEKGLISLMQCPTRNTRFSLLKLNIILYTASTTPIVFAPIPFEHLIIHSAFKGLSWLVHVSHAVAVACHLLAVTLLLREGRRLQIR